MTDLINAEDLVAKLFDNETEKIYSIAHITADEFAAAVLAAKTQASYSEKIWIHADYNTDLFGSVMELIGQVRAKLDDRAFDIFWSCFDVTLDISVMGGSRWAARILPNGALMFRNHHRVIAIDEQVGGILEVTNEQLLEELRIFEEYANKNISDDDTLFSVVHQNEEGITWTRSLPDKLSDVGQTVVLINQDLFTQLRDREDLDINNNSLFGSNAEELATNSHSGIAVIRVFANKSFMYSMSRAEDKYDMVLEEYAYYLGDGPDEKGVPQISISNNFGFVSNWIRNHIKENFQNLSILEHVAVSENTSLQVLLNQRLEKNYAQQKTWEVLVFVPFFGKKSGVPVAYGQDDSVYWTQSEAMSHELVVVQLNASGISNADEVVDTLSSRITSMVDTANFIASSDEVLVFLPPKSTETGVRQIEPSHLYAYGSEEMNDRLEEIADEMAVAWKRECDESEEISFSDYISSDGCDYIVAALLPTDGAADPTVAHGYAVTLSYDLDMSIMLEVPGYGLMQGYCAGELDTGNMASFLFEGNADDEHSDWGDDD